MGLALRGAVEKEIRRRPVSKERLQIARRIQRGVLVAGQSEGDVDCFVEIISAADAVAVVSGPTAWDVPVRIRAVGHERVDVRVDGAGDVPFVGGQALGYDERVERR